MSNWIMDRIGKGESCAVLARISRQNEATWQNTRSCLGGLAAVAACDWPRGETGPMHCVAQIDCAEMAKVCKNKALPQSGTLAFFADIADEGWIKSGAIRYITDEDRAAPPAPEFFPDVYGGSENCWITSLSKVQKDVLQHFPRWPVRFASARASHCEEGVALKPPLDEIIGKIADQVHFDMSGFAETTTRTFKKTVPSAAGQPPTVETTAITSNAEDVGPHHPLVAQVLLKDLEGAVEHFRAILANVENKCRDARHILEGAEPDVPLGDTVGAEFQQAVMQARSAMRSSPRNVFGFGTSASADAARALYFQMYSGTRAEYEAIPEMMRTHIEQTRLRSAYPSAPHQMFGLADDIQGQIPEGDTLLLQLGTDEAVSFMWGDVGVLQFLISNEDLAVGNWDAARMLMQGH